MKLTQLSRKTLEIYFNEKEFEPLKETKEKYKQERATFVTFTKDGELRGCIGSLKARQELWKDVIENTINAANDPRFSPLTKQELNKIKIEVSVLSPAKEIKFKEPETLLKNISKDMGIILQKGFNRATFLPQVWEMIPEKIEFLEELSLKAGLNKDEWKKSKIFSYKVKIEEEK